MYYIYSDNELSKRMLLVTTRLILITQSMASLLIVDGMVKAVI
jgi:hypothetical protein